MYVTYVKCVMCVMDSGDVATVLAVVCHDNGVVIC
jgi:hypothetical protein